MKPDPAVEPSTRQPEATAGPDLSGLELDDFKLLRRLGSGGMGDVYLAEQRSLQRRVAVKLLRSDLAASESYTRRFESEALAAARLTHANIVQIYAVGQAADRRYIAMELVEGTNLKKLIHKKGPLTVPAAVSILRQAAAALERAREAGIVHRDIKPENILITRKGEVKVADFGLSRQVQGGQALHLTQSGVVMGTPHYMSPEQVEGKELDHRSDIYSLGATAYCMLTGQPPFTGDSALAIAVQHVSGVPRPLQERRPDLPPALCRVVAKMMAKDRDKRYQSGRELLQDLQALRPERSGWALARAVATLPISGWRRTAIRTRAAVLAATAVALAAAAVLTRPGSTPAPSEQASAVAESIQPQEPVRWQGIQRQQTAWGQLKLALEAFHRHDPQALAALEAVEHFFPDARYEVRLALFKIGQVHLKARDADQAEAAFKRLKQNFDDEWAQVASGVGDGGVLVVRGLYVPARNLLAPLLSKLEDYGDLKCTALGFLRVAYQALGDTDNARRCQESLEQACGHLGRATMRPILQERMRRLGSRGAAEPAEETPP